MRIAILSTPFIRVPPAGYGGTELFCYELAEALHHRGHDVTIFTTGDSQVSCRKRSLYRRAEWPITPADEINHTAWAFEQVARRPHAFDVVQSNSVLGLPLARFVETPVVHTLHHRREEEFSRIYAIHPEVHYVAISQRQLDLEEPLPRASVIHHGVSPSRYPPSARDEGYLLHLGRFAPEKGTHLAIDVARLAGLPIKLAGRTHPCDAGYHREHVAPRLRHEGVEEVGEADLERKVALLRGARALVCPLQWEEPFGLAAIEALLCGTPVIGFARGSFPEIVEEGVTGYLVPDGDLHALAHRARSLDGFDRRACAERARERFSTSVMADRYEALYASLARPERRTRAA
jgi:glycosyltransferase involved in cell wall biosynthesis